MANLKNQNAGGKLKQSNVRKFARGGVYDSYSREGGCPCDCTEYGGTGTCTGVWTYGQCECYACCNPGVTSPRAAKNGGRLGRQGHQTWSEGYGAGGRARPKPKSKPTAKRRLK